MDEALTLGRDDDGNDEAVDSDNSRHDDGDERLHDEVGARNTHARDADPRLCGPVGCAKVGEEHGRGRPKVAEEGCPGWARERVRVDDARWFRHASLVSQRRGKPVRMIFSRENLPKPEDPELKLGKTAERGNPDFKAEILKARMWGNAGVCRVAPSPKSNPSQTHFSPRNLHNFVYDDQHACQ